MTVYRQQFTYSAVSTAFAPPATPTDMFIIQGSLTSNVYVLKMGFSSIQNADGVNIINLLKRSTANGGGAGSASTAVPFDSNNPAASATVGDYTTNAVSLGTEVGLVWSGYVNSPVVSAAEGGYQGVEVDFADSFGQPLCLLSPNEVLAWNFGGASLPAGLEVICYAVWYESSKT